MQETTQISTVSQHNFQAVNGARACAFIVLHAAERFAKKENWEFEALSDNDELMKSILQSIVDKGVQLNATYNVKQRLLLKEVEELLPLFRLKSLCLEPIPIMQQQTIKSITELNINLAEELSQDDVMYIAIGNNHVTLFFQRDENFYYFNSASDATKDIAKYEKKQALRRAGTNPYSFSKVSGACFRGMLHSFVKPKCASTVTTLSVHDTFESLFNELQQAWAGSYGNVMAVVDAKKYEQLNVRQLGKLLA